MAREAQGGEQPPRLNPFAFPAGTNSRFVLLIVATLGTSLFVYTLLYNSLPANQERRQSIETQCTQAAMVAHATNSINDMLARGFMYSECITPIKHEHGFWMLGGVAVLLLLSGGIYWLFPRGKIWRGKFKPLTNPKMAIYLENLCKEVGLVSPPIFLMNLSNYTNSGLAFGRFGRYYVVLNIGLVTKFITDPSAFRGVVSHELAHLRNADVDKTYFSVALGVAFLFVTVLPWVISRIGSPLIGTFNVSWRVFVLVALVYLTLCSVLRAREVYADVRASTWNRKEDGLQRMLSCLPSRRQFIPISIQWDQPCMSGSPLQRTFLLRAWLVGTQVGVTWLNTLWNAMALHPDPKERVRALNETDGLFRMGFWEAFATGITATIAFGNVATLLSDFISIGQNFLEPLGVALIIAPLTVGIVGVGVWRTAFAALARREARWAISLMGLGLGLGLLLGQNLSLAAFALASSEYALTGLALFVFDILWGAVVLISSFFFLHWIAAGATTWLEAALASRSPRPYYRLGLTIAGSGWALWLALLYFIYPIRAVGNFISSSAMSRALVDRGLSVPEPLPLVLGILAIGIILASPLTLLSFIGLWAFPLAAWFRRKRIALASKSSWALLDPSTQPLSVLDLSPLRLGLALSIGGVGGIVSCALVLLVGFGLRSADPTIYLNWLFTGLPLLAVVLQAFVAAIAAGWVRRLGSLHGLFAAFVAGCIIAVGTCIDSLFYLGADSSFSWSLLLWGIFSMVVNGGTLLALSVALCTSALAGWARRLFDRYST